MIHWADLQQAVMLSGPCLLGTVAQASGMLSDRYFVAAEEGSSDLWLKSGSRVSSSC